MCVADSLISLPSLIVNGGVFDAVYSEIVRSKGVPIPQPIVIVGQGGSGKSTVLRRLYDACEGRPRVWIDGRTIFSTDEILCAGSLTNDTLLFIDDMDYYLTRCSYEEQYRLRRLLYNEGAPMLIATLSAVLPAVTEYDAPFFEGLKITYIPPVTATDISRSFSGESLERMTNLLALMSPTIESVICACEIIVSNDDPDKDRVRLLSMFSEKYRTLYKSLPTNSQRILNTLGGADKCMTMPEIRSWSGLPTNILTAYLKRLRDLDIISVDKSAKKNAVYSLKDSLFGLWLARYSPS